MPGIGDLLAEITGDKQSPASVPRPAAASRPAPPTATQKRKAEDDIRNGNEFKAARVVPKNGAGDGPGGQDPAKTVRPADKAASSLSRSSTPQKAAGKSVAPPKALNGNTRQPTGQSVRTLHGGSNGTKGREPASKKPTAAVAPVASVSKAQPKKGSYAEIMARAKAAQESGVRVGQITHKAVERGPSKREREEIKAEMRASLKKAARSQGSVRSPISASRPRHGTPSTGILRERERERAAPAKRPAERRPAEEDQDRKSKKSVTATTGYTGTARPRPGTAKKKDVPRGGALMDTRPRGKGSRYDDEYDEELDDFIEYDDDEEEDPGQRRGYDYDSDNSSDMEAGLDELDVEEQRAAVIARREDVREEREEAERRRAKEQRKRQALLDMQRGRRY